MSKEVEQIKDNLDIVDVISSYIKVEKAGINFKAKCPFHNEKTPSFFISPTRQSFYCFGCGEKGDIFSFVEKFENIDFKEALEKLADKAGVTLSKKKLSKEDSIKDQLWAVMEEATKYYENQIGNENKIIDYLLKRGLGRNSIIKWRLGFAQVGWRNLYDYLLDKKFPKNILLQAGLIKKVPSQEKYYDTFRERIIFPINDTAGRVIAFSGRSLKEEAKIPKYLNSPETKLFYKSEVLYGFDLAKNYIRQKDYAVLVEGQFDLIMSHQVGVQNTVASSGTALTELHLKKIQKLSNRIIIAYDSDEAGEKAAKKAAEMALSLGMEAKIASLAKNQDPAEIIRNNPKDWVTALKKSSHFTDFILDKTINENEGKNLSKEIIKNVLPLAIQIKSHIEKEQYVKKIAQKIKVREEDVWNDINKIEINQKKIISKNQNKEEDYYRDKKEELIIEAEKFGLKIDIAKVNEEISKRAELKKLKQKFQETAMALDEKNISASKAKELELDLKRIEKQIKEINF